MNAITKIEPTAAVVLFESEKFNAFYAKLKADIEAVPIDLKTDKGRKAIASAAAKVRTEKASIDRDRKRLTQEWRDMTAQVNGAWKSIEAQLDELAVEARRPLTEWEEAEKRRIELCQATIDAFKRAAIVTLEDTAATVRERGKDVWGQEIDPAQFGDMLDEAVAAKDTAVVSLKAALARLTREEEERAELERLRAAQAEREEADRAAAEAAERVEQRRKHARATIEHIHQCGLGMIGGKAYPYVILIRELEEKVIVTEDDFGDMAADVETARRDTLDRVLQAQKDDAERLQREAADKAAKDAREEEARKAEAAAIQRQREHDEAIAAERRRAEEAEAAMQAERDRVAKVEAERIAEEKRAAEAQAALEADSAHRSAIQDAATKAIMAAGSIEEPTAKMIVLAIASGNVPHITLGY